MSGAYEHLYTPQKKAGWVDRLSPEAREWVEGLVAYAREHGEPIWAQVWRTMRDRFPADCPETETTIRENVRKLI